LQVFLDECSKRGIEPKKNYSGKFNVRVPSELHEKIVSVAEANGMSLNQWIVNALNQSIQNTMKNPQINEQGVVSL